MTCFLGASFCCHDYLAPIRQILTHDTAFEPQLNSLGAKIQTNRSDRIPKSRVSRANYTSKWSSWHHLYIKTIFNVIKGHSRLKLTKKGQKGQISNLLENSQIILQNEALGVRFSKKFVSRSLKVNKSQKSRKRSNFKFDWKYTNYTSKLNSWRKIFKNICVKFIRGQQRSEIAKRSN